MSALQRINFSQAFNTMRTTIEEGLSELNTRIRRVYGSVKKDLSANFTTKLSWVKGKLVNNISAPVSVLSLIALVFLSPLFLAFGTLGVITWTALTATMLLTLLLHVQQSRIFTSLLHLAR